jgi:homoserine kinase
VSDPGERHLVTPANAVTVEVPASSANLGPGFDALGLALALYLRTTVVRAVEDSLAVSGEGADHLRLGADNRFLAGLERGVAVLGGRRPPLRMEMHNEIPLARGLGSSAAAAVAGLLTACALLGRPSDRVRIVELAAELDGHADNVAASVFGGFVIVSHDTAGQPRASRFDPPAGLTGVLFVPALTLSTEEMRAVLPDTVAHADATHNVAATALVVAAMIGDRPELLGAMAADRLHQPYRAAQLPQLPEIVAAARSAGALGAALSGAGSAILALTNDSNRAQPIAAAMSQAAARLGLEGAARIVSPDLAGARTITR